GDQTIEILGSQILTDHRNRPATIASYSAIFTRCQCISVPVVFVVVWRLKVMSYRKFVSLAISALLVLSTVSIFFAGNDTKKGKTQNSERVVQPLNLAVLIQDDLISQVANEIGVTRDFIRTLPAGSRVMVGYITSGSLQVKQSFTTDLDKAAQSLRIP